MPLIRHLTCVLLALCTSTASLAQSADESDALDFLLTESTDETSNQQPGEEYDDGSQASATEQPTETIELAPDAPPKVTPHRRVGAMVEEIIVTAQKREEDLQSVPITISAFTGEALDVKGISDPTKLQYITPSLDYGTMANYSQIYIRGVGSDVFIPHASPSVATYIDGVYFPFVHGLASSFGEIERVEILKGPQGTLFGVNSTAGAINIISKDPAEEFSGGGQVSYARFNDLQTKGFLSGPLGNHFGANLDLMYNTREEYYTAEEGAAIQDFQDYFEAGARLKLKWAPTENFDATLTLMHLETEGAGTHMFDVIRPQGLVGTAAGAGSAQGTDYAVSLSQLPFAFGDTQVGYLNLGYTGPWFDIKTISAHEDLQTHTQIDYDGFGADLVGVESLSQIGIVDTHELQILSNDQFGPSWLEWVFGLHYYTNETGTEGLDFFVAGLNDPLSTGVCLPFNVCLPSLPLGGAFEPGGHLRLVGLIDTDSISGYLHTNITLTNWLDMTLAGRYQVETRMMHDSSSNLVVNNGSVTPLFQWQDREYTTQNFSPKVSLNFHLGDDHLLFASWQEGFKSATYNILNIYQDTQLVLPEEITTYELGIKSTFFDGALVTNGAIFHNEITNMQSQFVALTSGGATALENAANAETQGAEIDVNLLLGNSLLLTLGGTYLQSEFTSYPNARGYNQTTGLFQSNFDYTGHDVPRNPKFTGIVGLVYSMTMGPGEMELAADYYYNDGFYFNNQNTDKQEAYSLVNARISYLHAPSNLRLTVFGENINDSRRYLYQFSQDFAVVGKLIQPPSYGARIEWDF